MIIPIYFWYAFSLVAFLLLSLCGLDACACVYVSVCNCVRLCMCYIVSEDPNTPLIGVGLSQLNELF